MILDVAGKGESWSWKEQAETVKWTDVRHKYKQLLYCQHVGSSVHCAWRTTSLCWLYIEIFCVDSYRLFLVESFYILINKL